MLLNSEEFLHTEAVGIEVAVVHHLICCGLRNIKVHVLKIAMAWVRGVAVVECTLCS